MDKYVITGNGIKVLKSDTPTPTLKEKEWGLHVAILQIKEEGVDVDSYQRRLNNMKITFDRSFTEVVRKNTTDETLTDSARDALIKSDELLEQFQKLGDNMYKLEQDLLDIWKKIQEDKDEYTSGV